MRCPLLLILLISAPVAAAPVPGPLTPQEQASARKIYVSKCAKCHRFYEPKNYDQTEWTLWMDKMSKKSKLKDQQSALLRRYLDAYRSGELADKPENRPKSGSRGK